MTENIKKPEEINQAGLTNEQLDAVAGGCFVTGTFTCSRCGKKSTMKEITGHSKTCQG